jgi:hypothetical protein
MTSSGLTATGDLPDDVSGLCTAMTEAQNALRSIEVQQLRLAVHWLDLHAPGHAGDAPGRAGGRGRVLPGMERAIASGADGTPMITEFSCAEFAALHDMHPLGGQAYLRKVANLRHRHPQLYDRVLLGEVAVWKALETARLVGRRELALGLDQALWIDGESFEWITTLPWTSFLDHLERLIIDADPRGAEERRLEAATRQGVWTTQVNDHGLKTLVARAGAGEIVYLVAVVDKIAEILALHGDERAIGPRRASAMGILAHPAHALSLLAQHTATDAEDHIEPAEDDPADEHPTREDGATDDRPSYLGCPDDLRSTLTQLDRLGGPGLERLLPRATLYVHVDRSVFCSGRGSAYVEGVGPVTVQQACELLGHRRVKVTEVLDLAVPVDPVDGYTFTTRMREQLHLVNPRDVFPFGVNTGRNKDIDHPVPYQPPDGGGSHSTAPPSTGPPSTAPRSTGPPGPVGRSRQTGLHNAAPMTRFHHRIKTFGGWQLFQLGPGSYLWRSPHQYSWFVDARGTHRIPNAVVPWLLPDRDGGERTTAA